MKKIPTALLRDPDNPQRVLIDTITPGCEWVLGPDVIARRKWDGTCVGLDEAYHWWARREVKPGKRAPEGFVALQLDEATGKTQGWEPIGQSPFRKAHADAMNGADAVGQIITPGTYELVGESINANPELVTFGHMLVRHDTTETLGEHYAPHSPEGIAAMALEAGARRWEGLVFYGPLVGQLAKIKVKDVRS